MVEKWKKFINKSPHKREIKKILQDLANNTLSTYDIKPLTGHKGYFRLRKGKIRIVFIKTTTGNKVKAIDTRGNIYKNT